VFKFIPVNHRHNDSFGLYNLKSPIV